MSVCVHSSTFLQELSWPSHGNRFQTFRTAAAIVWHNRLVTQPPSDRTTSTKVSALSDTCNVGSVESEWAISVQWFCVRLSRVSWAIVSGEADALNSLFSCSSWLFLASRVLIWSFKSSTSSLTANIRWLFTKSYNINTSQVLNYSECWVWDEECLFLTFPLLSEMWVKQR